MCLLTVLILFLLFRVHLLLFVLPFPVCFCLLLLLSQAILLQNLERLVRDEGRGQDREDIISLLQNIGHEVGGVGVGEVRVVKVMVSVMVSVMVRVMVTLMVRVMGMVMLMVG